MVAQAVAFFIFAWFLVGSIIVGVAVRALVLKYLWAWYAVPALGLAPISYGLAAGVILIGMLWQSMPPYARKSSEDDDDEQTDAKKPAAQRADLARSFRDCESAERDAEITRLRFLASQARGPGAARRN